MKHQNLQIVKNTLEMLRHVNVVELFDPALCSRCLLRPMFDRYVVEFKKRPWDESTDPYNDYDQWVTGRLTNIAKVSFFQIFQAMMSFKVLDYGYEGLPAKRPSIFVHTRTRVGLEHFWDRQENGVFLDQLKFNPPSSISYPCVGDDDNPSKQFADCLRADLDHFLKEAGKLESYLMAIGYWPRGR